MFCADFQNTPAVINTPKSKRQICIVTWPVLLKAEMLLYKRLHLKHKADRRENANNWMKMYKFSVSLSNSIKMYGDK